MLEKEVGNQALEGLVHQLGVRNTLLSFAQ